MEGKYNIPVRRNQYENPFVFVADSAFALNRYIMKKYRGRNLSRAQKVFNYRLGRARRIVENAFGIMANRFRCLLKPMELSVESAKLATIACCILHNFMLSRNTTTRANYFSAIADRELLTGEFVNGNWRSGIRLRPMPISRHANATSNEATAIRTHFLNYFNNEGAVEFQNNDNLLQDERIADDEQVLNQNDETDDDNDIRNVAFNAGLISYD